MARVTHVAFALHDSHDPLGNANYDRGRARRKGPNRIEDDMIGGTSLGAPWINIGSRATGLTRTSSSAMDDLQEKLTAYTQQLEQVCES